MIEPALLVLLLRLTVVGAIFTEMVPRTWTLWSMRATADGYGTDRLRTWLKSAGILLISVFESVLWTDYLLADQRVLGTFTDRWVLDAAVWSLMVVGSIQVARLYWAIEWKRGRARS